MDVASCVVQVRVVVCPGRIEAGLAVNVTLGLAEFTVIVTDAVAVPPGPVAVAV
jgi:hypothetical protein